MTGASLDNSVMSFDEQLHRAFDSVADQMREETKRRMAALTDELRGAFEIERGTVAARAAVDARRDVEQEIPARVAAAVAAAQAGMLEAVAAAEARGAESGRDAGRAEGRATGLGEGRAAGLEEGRLAGIAAGRQQGLEEGRRSGFESGQQQGRQEGFEDGRRSGFESGLQQGRQAGKDEGRREGREAGIDEGKRVGIDEGKRAGIDEGKRAGIEEGQRAGFEEGKSAGIEEGKRVGVEDGKRAGFEEGQRAGREEGRKEGRAEGKKEGHQEGWEAGCEAGKAQGREEGKRIGREEGLQEGVELGLAQGRAEGERTGREAALDAGPASDAETALADQKVAELAASARLIEAVRAIDRAWSLTDILDTLVSSAGAEARRAAVLLVRGGQLRGWRFIGFGQPLDEQNDVDVPVADAGVIAEAARTGVAVSADSAAADTAPAFALLPPGREVLAVPVSMGGQIVAVLYADQGPDDTARADGAARLTWPFVVELLARHAARCLEAITAFRAAKVLTERPDVPGETRARDGESADARTPDTTDTEDSKEGARRYARLLVSEIKLYHESAVIAGRKEGDLTTRLGGEIARARVLYEQRVPAHVRLGHDHFHDELVKTLAGGDPRLMEVKN